MYGKNSTKHPGDECNGLVAVLVSLLHLSISGSEIEQCNKLIAILNVVLELSSVVGTIPSMFGPGRYFVGKDSAKSMACSLLAIGRPSARPMFDYPCYCGPLSPHVRFQHRSIADADAISANTIATCLLKGEEISEVKERAVQL